MRLSHETSLNTGQIPKYPRIAVLIDILTLLFLSNDMAVCTKVNKKKTQVIERQKPHDLKGKDDNTNISLQKKRHRKII